MIMRPKLLLADELTGNLDSVNRNNVMDLLVRLNRPPEFRFCSVTHDQEIAKKMHRVLVMKDGVFTAPS